MKRTRWLTVMCTLFICLDSSATSNVQESTPSPAYPGIQAVAPCERLLDIKLLDTRIDSATIENGVCRIDATVTHPPAYNPIRVFVALPLQSWNGRFRGSGGGGYAGGFVQSLSEPTKHGYAVAATDTGNPAGTANFAIAADGKLAWSRLRDNAYGGIHEMSEVGKALTRAFYGKPPRYSYFIAGSTGGRQALTEAQRYPDDYDGILALYPAIARDRYVPAQLWPQVLMHEANDFLPNAKLVAATEAAIKACADSTGVIEDPTQCGYDPIALVGTKIEGTEFTATDAKIIKAIWDGPIAHDGHRLWWGPTRGTDLSNFAGTSGSPLTGKPCEEGMDWFRYFVMLDPNWDWTTLTRDSFELLFEQSIQIHSSIYGGDDPDLDAFRKHGGKLLIVHGWSDQYVPAQKSIDYYRAVKRRMGSATAESLRLFLVPGADHGFSKRAPAPTNETMITALMNWVEKGHAPSTLDAKQFDDAGTMIKQRTLHAYLD